MQLKNNSFVFDEKNNWTVANKQKKNKKTCALMQSFFYKNLGTQTRQYLVFEEINQ